MIDEMDKVFDKSTPDGRTYREWIDEESGDTYREYEQSGVITNYTKRRITRGYFTKENAAELQLMGAEAKVAGKVEAARKGLVRGVGATELVNDYNMAWEFVVAAQAELALAVDMGNASTRAAEFIAKMADMAPDKHEVALSDGKRSLELSNIDTETLNRILSRL